MQPFCVALERSADPGWMRVMRVFWCRQLVGPRLSAIFSQCSRWCIEPKKFGMLRLL